MWALGPPPLPTPIFGIEIEARAPAKIARHCAPSSEDIISRLDLGLSPPATAAAGVLLLPEAPLHRALPFRPLPPREPSTTSLVEAVQAVSGSSRWCPAQAAVAASIIHG